MSDDDHKKGLMHKYDVERRNDPDGKHDTCRYFVLDPQHDPLARVALAAYAARARTEGYESLANDLDMWLFETDEDDCDD